MISTLPLLSRSVHSTEDQQVELNTGRERRGLASMVGGP